MAHTKEALLGAAVSAVAQNVVGIPIARSKRFKSGLARSALMGAAGKKAPRTLKSMAKDAVAGVAAPEVNIMHNSAYDAGSKLRNKLKLHKASKRDMVVARLSAAGDDKGLKRIGKDKSPLAQKIRYARSKNGIPAISKASQKSAMKDIKHLKDGHRVPSSNKVALAANAAILPLPGGAGTAAVNVGKMALSSKAAEKSKLLQKINKKLVKDPLQNSAKRGRAGKAYNKAKHWAQSVGLNPFTEEASRMAHSAGTKSRSK